MKSKTLNLLFSALAVVLALQTHSQAQNAFQRAYNSPERRCASYAGSFYGPVRAANGVNYLQRSYGAYQTYNAARGTVTGSGPQSCYQAAQNTYQRAASYTTAPFRAADGYLQMNRNYYNTGSPWQFRR